MSRDHTGRFAWALPAIALVVLLLAAYIWLHARTPNAPERAAAASEVPGKIKTKPSLPVYASRESVPSASPTFPVADDGTVAIPLRFQLPGVTRTKSGINSKEWLAQYPVDQQEKIQAFNTAHFGVYSINSPQQVAWMAENGYPMPEDVIAAERLSDADLRELAKQGNDKAGFLLRERTSAATKAGLDNYHAQGKTNSDFWNNDPNARQITMDDLTTMQLLQQSHSPFKGYVQALDSVLKDDPVSKDATIIAGLHWAQSLGDFRAEQFLDAFVQGNPMRQAMASAAGAATVNGNNDKIQMSTNGCENAGVPPGLYIPGNFSPVE